jgi:hypothetical protein
MEILKRKREFVVELRNLLEKFKVEIEPCMDYDYVISMDMCIDRAHKDGDIVIIGDEINVAELNKWLKENK